MKLVLFFFFILSLSSKNSLSKEVDKIYAPGNENLKENHLISEIKTTDVFFRIDEKLDLFLKNEKYLQGQEINLRDKEKIKILIPPNANQNNNYHHGLLLNYKRLKDNLCSIDIQSEHLVHDWKDQKPKRIVNTASNYLAPSVRELIPVNEITKLDFKNKDLMYLLRRELNLSPDDFWRYTKDGKKIVIQRRFEVKLSKKSQILFSLSNAQKLIGVSTLVSLPGSKNEIISLDLKDPKYSNRKYLKFEIGKVLSEIYQDLFNTAGVSPTLKEIYLHFDLSQEEFLSNIPLKKIYINDQFYSHPKIRENYKDQSLYLDFSKVINPRSRKIEFLGGLIMLSTPENMRSCSMAINDINLVYLKEFKVDYRISKLIKFLENYNLPTKHYLDINGIEIFDVIREFESDKQGYLLTNIYDKLEINKNNFIYFEAPEHHSEKQQFKLQITRDDNKIFSINVIPNQFNFFDFKSEQISALKILSIGGSLGESEVGDVFIGKVKRINVPIVIRKNTPYIHYDDLLEKIPKGFRYFFSERAQPEQSVLIKKDKGQSFVQKYINEISYLIIFSTIIFLFFINKFKSTKLGPISTGVAIIIFSTLYIYGYKFYVDFKSDSLIFLAQLILVFLWQRIDLKFSAPLKLNFINNKNVSGFLASIFCSLLLILLDYQNIAEEVIVFAYIFIVFISIDSMKQRERNV